MPSSLVTGGAGFIGSHLTEALLERGDRVWVLDDESTGSAENLQDVAGHPRLACVRGSVLDAALVGSVLDDARPDAVYHLAAAVGVGLLARDPVGAMRTNVLGTEVLLGELVRRPSRGPAPRLFLASSSEVYGNNPSPQWREDDALILGPTDRPRWSYGASKAMAEFLALAHARQHGLDVVVGRFFNVVGPRQVGRYGMVLPRLVDAALDGGPLVVYDDGRQVRCFAHVADVVAAVLAVTQSPGAPGAVLNIGGDEPATILDLARRVAAAVDPSLRIEFRAYADVYGGDFDECRRRVPDLGRLTALLGAGRPRRPLDATIAEVVRWRRAARGGG